MGGVAQNGCRFCCSFNCTQTPTPTPKIDEEGREVFTFTAGRFILALETKRGTSNLHAGTCVGPLFGPPCPSHAGSPPDYDRQRPDGQLVFDQKLGNGNPTVCDLGPPPTGGGIPGNPGWLSIPGGQDVTKALQDASCKFESSVANSPSDACTLGKNGLPNFIDSTTTRQYCFVVPQTSKFPVGRTIVAFQARDTRGNLGPRKEIVVEILSDD